MSGSEIKALRDSMGLSQVELAGVLGVNRGQISHWETQTKVPDTPNQTLLDLLARQRDAWVCDGGLPTSYGQLLRERGQIPATLPTPYQLDDAQPPPTRQR